MSFQANLDYFLILENNQVLSIEQNGEALLETWQIHHYRKVLRIKNELELYVSDGNGKCCLSILKPNNYIIQKENWFQVEKNKIQKSLLLPSIKKHNIEFLIQKSTELGIYSFNFIKSDYTTSHLPNADRLQEIAKNACRQSMNPYLPIFNITSSNLINYPFNNNSMYLWGKQNSSKSLNDVVNITSLQNKNEIVFINGPEGGWSKQEELFLSENFPSITLSRNILRAETAAICVIYHLNNLC